MIMRLMIFSAILSGISFGCHLRARGKVREKIAFHDNLNYSQNNDKDAGFDLYVPKSVPGKMPAVVFIHGGYWRNQARSYYQAFTGLYQNFGLALASRGVATAVIDYRLFPGAKFEDEMADVANAVAYLKKNAEKYAIDPREIYLVGHSAGGHLALMTLWQAKNADVKSAVALSPILDIAHMRRNKEADFNNELTVPFFGAGDDDARYSPVTYAVPGVRPALLIFGGNDYAYLIEQGKTYTEKFLTAGLRQIRTEWVPGNDHSDMVLNVHTPDDKVSDLITAWITEQRSKN